MNRQWSLMFKRKFNSDIAQLIQLIKMFIETHKHH